MSETLLDMFRWAGKNIARKGMQTSLTILGIAIGVFSVVIISSIGNMGRMVINTQLEGMGFDCITVSPVKKDLNILNSELLAEVNDIDGVLVAAPLINGMGQAVMRDYIGEAMVCGVDQNAAQIISLQTTSGHFLRRSDIAAGERVCVVDEDMAMSYYQRTNIVGKTVALTVGNVTEDFEIIGVVSAESNILQAAAGDLIPSFVFIPYTTMQEMTGKSTIDQLFVRVDGAEPAEVVGEKVISELDKQAGYKNLYRYEDLAVQKERLNSILEVVTTVLSAIGAVSLLVSGLSIMTIMTVSVRDRTREIGIKKAVGAKKRDILLEFLLESLLITCLGSAAGILLSIGVMAAANLLLGLSLSVDLRTLVTIAVYSGLVGIAFGVYPAKLAAALRPVDALRYE